VAVAALLIATKYEEIYPPTMKDFLFICDKQFTRDEILKMEANILACVDFDVQMHSPYRFLERFSKVAKFDTPMFYFA